MIKSIKVNKKDEIGKRLNFRKCELKQVNFLFGPNGVGKTTLLNEIFNIGTDRGSDNVEVNLEKNKKHCSVKYFNSVDNYNSDGYNAKTTDEIILKLKTGCLSEGERVIFSLNSLLRFFEMDNDRKEDGDYIVLIDEFDSGMSINNIVNTMKRIYGIVQRKSNVQFIISFNNYEVIGSYPGRLSDDKVSVINMMTGREIRIVGYKNYRNYIITNGLKLENKRKGN